MRRPYPTSVVRDDKFGNFVLGKWHMALAIDRDYRSAHYANPSKRCPLFKTTVVMTYPIPVSG
jgi:hypothetical protein